MITVIIQFEVDKHWQEEFKRLLEESTLNRQKAKGNWRSELFQDTIHPHHFILIEIFDQQAAIDVYYQSQAYLTWFNQVKPMVLKISGSDCELLIQDQRGLPKKRK